MSSTGRCNAILNQGETHVSSANINDISPWKALPLPRQKPNRLSGRQRWWKTRRALNRYDSETRYSLIVSLHAPETGVDLLTPVQLKVDALIASQIEITS